MAIRPGTPPSIRELRIARRLEARGQQGLFGELLKLRGFTLGEGYSLGRLLAVGGEGALFDVHSEVDPSLPLVGKLPVVPWHAPVDLTSRVLRLARAIIDHEANLLETAGSPFLPRFEELLEFENPLLEAARGGEFAEPEPCLVMERLSGHDLDVWSCRMHRGGHAARATLRASFDRIAVWLLHSLVDLEGRGFLYADLRPGNLRVVGRPERRVRLLDAGSCVRPGEDGGRFPHVPSYLPPALLRVAERGTRLVATPEIQAVMAGRTLYEVATGEIPHAGAPVDVAKLLRAPISPNYAEVITALANGDCADCATALDHLSSEFVEEPEPSGAS
jgi:hypothetical protein